MQSASNRISSIWPWIQRLAYLSTHFTYLFHSHRLLYSLPYAIIWIYKIPYAYREILLLESTTHCVAGKDSAVTSLPISLFNVHVYSWHRCCVACLRWRMSCQTSVLLHNIVPSVHGRSCFESSTRRADAKVCTSNTRARNRTHALIYVHHTRKEMQHSIPRTNPTEWGWKHKYLTIHNISFFL